MKTFKPIHAVALILGFAALVLAADQLSRSRRAYSNFERVGAGADGLVHIDVADLEQRQVRFYRFLNAGNQEVRFLVGRDQTGTIQVGFDASPTHAKLGRGFSYQDGWLIDNKCETTTRLSAVNAGGHGCKPVAIEHRLEGQELIITEADMLQGWRYFR